MNGATDLPMSAAGALLRRLTFDGIDAVFVNSGTDFPPIVEALAEAEAHDIPVPRMVLAPHEHIAMGMAHGYYFATGRAQAVILHTNVGLANGAIGAINAATDHVPMLLMSGRTPTLERDRFGARTVPIGWGQEMRDQTALVRETSKWDYELRFPEQIPELVDRALAIAESTPPGPVYLSLPREVLSQPCPEGEAAAPRTMHPARVTADADLIAQAAAALAEAERPVIFAQRGAGTAEGFAALASITDAWSIPVCQYWAVATAISADHPMYVGQDPSPWIEEADVVLVINSLAPWSPDVHRPRAGTVIQLGPDPLFDGFPVRNFASHLTIRGEVGDALVRLEAAMTQLDAGAAGETRRRRIVDWNMQRRADQQAAIAAGSGSPMSKEFAAHCLGEALGSQPVTVLSELGCPLDPIGLTGHQSWRQEPHSGGLGWAFPCGMGIKMADPDRLVIATMGDGSYLFANPVACHQVAARQDIPLLVVVLNNGSYEAVAGSVRGSYPTGYAAKEETVPLTDVDLGRPLAGVAAACGAHAETVHDGADLPAAMARAIEVVTVEQKQAFVEVMIG